jgi:hypothetical protein
MSDPDAGWVRSRVVGGIVGVFAGGLTIFLIESGAAALLGPAHPGDLSSATAPMFASVLIAWTVGAALAAAVATHWSRSSTLTVGVVTGSVLFAGSVGTMIAIPHPAWMVIATVVLMPSAAGVAAWTVSRARSA